MTVRSDSPVASARQVTLSVGDAVVYAAHGTGVVVAREQRMILGSKRHVVVIELGQTLTVTLTLEQARERLRPVASEADLRRVRETLRADAEVGPGNWQQRLRAGRAKLASGDVLGLAEIVRDGVRHRSDRGAALSGTEQRLYLQARQLLAEEIGKARGLDQPEADAWIGEQARPA